MNTISSALLPHLDLPRPHYERTGVTPGIVHFGVGGFHRSHEAMVVDALLERGRADGWGIVGVGLLPQDAQMASVMADQDSLYSLMLKHPDGHRELRVIGSLIEFIHAPQDTERVLERLVAPSTRIVSLTITEGGYSFNQVSGAFIPSDSMRAELVDGAPPTSVFGYIVEALRHRRAAGIQPFTVMSCDNIQGNGHIAQGSVIGFAALHDHELAEWIQSEVAFPNSMVDRITPVTSDADRTEVEKLGGYRDAWPVVAEPYFQWVLEDRFPAGRPPFEEAGVQLVDDVEPYELMKLRLLNIGHQALTYFGYLAGYRFAHEATADPLIVRLLECYMLEEGKPTLRPVPGVDVGAYSASLIERFQNPEVQDTLTRLCAESSDRIPKWLLPVIRENLAAGRQVRLSAAIVASWARYAEGVDEGGEAFVVVDRLVDRVQHAARAWPVDELAFLRDRELFGDIVDDARFTEPYLDALRALHLHGSTTTLRRLLDERGPDTP